jgi:putative MATE family efflux protein
LLMTLVVAIFMKIIKEKSFYITLIAITLPLALQNFVYFMIGTADTIMLGQLGEIQLCASSLANQPFFIFLLMIFGLAGGANVLISQYWGKKDIQTIKKIFSIVVKITIICSFIFAMVILLMPKHIMQIYSTDVLVIEQGVKYLNIIGYAYIFVGVSNIFFSTIRSVEIVKISAVSAVISLVLNVSLNWVLIFGNLGFKPMGIEGAAIATLITRVFEVLVIIIYVFLIDKKIALKLKDFLTFDSLLLKDFTRYAIPVVCNEVMWALGITVQVLVIGRLGTPEATASAISNLMQQLVTIFIFGVANAAAVIIGKTIGQGYILKAKAQAFTINLLAIIFGIIAFAVVFLLRDFAMGFYSIPQATKQLASNIMLVNSIVLIFLSVSAVNMIGVLRAGGDTKYSFILEFFSLWGVSVPLAIILGLWLRLPVVIVFGFMKIDELIKAVFCFYRTFGNRWIRNVTR